MINDTFALLLFKNSALYVKSTLVVFVSPTICYIKKMKAYQEIVSLDYHSGAYRCGWMGENEF